MTVSTMDFLRSIMDIAATMQYSPINLLRKTVRGGTASLPTESRAWLHGGSGVGERFLKSSALFACYFRLRLLPRDDFAGLEDFTAIQAFDVLRLVVLGDQLRAAVLAAGSRHEGVNYLHYSIGIYKAGEACPGVDKRPHLPLCVCWH